MKKIICTILFLCLSGIGAKAAETMPAFKNVKAKPKHSMIELSWEYPKTYERIEIKRDGKVITYNEINSSFLDYEPLKGSTTYHYELIAVDKNGNRSPSYKLNVTTLEGLNFLYKNNALNIDWNTLKEEEYFPKENQKFVIYYLEKTEENQNYKKIDIGTHIYTYTDTDLKPGSTYQYQLNYMFGDLYGVVIMNGEITIPFNTVSVMPYTELYSTPNKRTQLPYSLDGQEVTVVEKINEFTKIKTWKGDLYVDNTDIAQPFKENKQLYLVKNASLYSNPSFKSKTGGVLAPQPVKIIEKGNNGWFKIKTDIGSKWVYISESFYTGNEYLDVKKQTILYDNVGKVNKHAVIAPQMVRLFGESNDYYAISTWLGMKYIKK